MMGAELIQPGAHMAAEIAQAPAVFTSAVAADHANSLAPLALGVTHAFYTVARGSSDAAANILSYEFMRHLGLPVTSLPPSTFSVFNGVRMAGSTGIVISQSGASDDLVSAARGIQNEGGQVVTITNQPGSNVQKIADAHIPIAAGPELAVPATKTVIGSIGAGMAMLAALHPAYRAACENAASAMQKAGRTELPNAQTLATALRDAKHVYVIGRGAGFGAAHEVALKIKETCAIHAEAYSASEVLHGPLQLASNRLLVLILDTEEPRIQDSLDQAENRFKPLAGNVLRIRLSDIETRATSPAAASAILLYLVYPIIKDVALALGLNPDSPATLSKVTKTL